MANTYHRAPTRHLKIRRSSASVVARTPVPFSRSVSTRAISAGANTPSRKAPPASSVGTGLADARPFAKAVAVLPREIAKDAAQQIHVAAYVSKKNLRRERMMVSARVG